MYCQNIFVQKKKNQSCIPLLMGESDHSPESSSAYPETFPKDLGPGLCSAPSISENNVSCSLN